MLTIGTNQFEEWVNKNRKKIGLPPQITTPGIEKESAEKLDFNG